MSESVETVMTAPAVAEPETTPDSVLEVAGTSEDQGLVVDDLLVEDVSIDGMCGVY